MPLASEAAVAVFQVINQRYLKGSICLTTNLQVGSWGKVFDDPWWRPSWAGSCTAVLSSTSTGRLPDARAPGPIGAPTTAFKARDRGRCRHVA
jgi:hypothetical protein